MRESWEPDPHLVRLSYLNSIILLYNVFGVWVVGDCGTRKNNHHTDLHLPLVLATIIRIYQCIYDIAVYRRC